MGEIKKVSPQIQSVRVQNQAVISTNPNQFNAVYFASERGNTHAALHSCRWFVLHIAKMTISFCCSISFVLK